MQALVEEIVPDIAALGISPELLQAIRMTKEELERLLAIHATPELIQDARKELARLLVHRLSAMAPKALHMLDEAVEKGSLRAIENVLDRSGYPRVSRSNVFALTANVDLGRTDDFAQYVEAAGGDLDVVEAALSQLKADAE